MWLFFILIHLLFPLNRERMENSYLFFSDKKIIWSVLILLNQQVLLECLLQMSNCKHLWATQICQSSCASFHTFYPTFMFAFFFPPFAIRELGQDHKAKSRVQIHQYLIHQFSWREIGEKWQLDNVPELINIVLNQSHIPFPTVLFPFITFLVVT